MKIPATFRFQDQSRYPIDNTIDFEYYCTTVLPDKIGDREYLPITWTAYYKTCKYGADVEGVNKLNQFLRAIDKRKKWFTICQWDNGVINDVSHLDLMQFNMGSPGDYQLPLICQPHAFTFPRLKKDIFCSFVGRITHPIRSEIVRQLTGKEGYYISTQSHKLGQFCEILARSKYVLCPRGYGATSFRICEALQYGAVPVYVSDVFLRPHNHEYKEIKEVRSDLFSGRNLEAVIGSFDFIDKKQQLEPSVLYKMHFTYEANRDLIIKALSKV